jgi:hypothetical protein
VWSGLVTATQTAATAIVNVFKTALDTTTGFFTSLVDDVLGAFGKIIAAAKSVGGAISAAFSGDASAGDAGGTQNFAAGGAIRGRGTGTSDSIWARVSNGEFVQRFAAVRKYGVDFMAAINSLRIPAASVRALMSGVNFSGFGTELSSAMQPRSSFAVGGLQTLGAALSGNGMTPIHLHLPNGNAVGPLYGDADAVRAISKAFRAADLRSMGRKPSWVT